MNMHTATATADAAPSILDHLVAAADALDRNATATAPDDASLLDTVRALRAAADFLYEATERVSLGDALNAPSVAQRVTWALSKVEEARRVRATAA
ncbi:hypothetical protein [Paracoccus sp. SJTW-4]|uniref:hypothetical protein n=1 Tax=Paracoccus sp. SJTW-4 TaxID=3078428 RepID=UPI0039ECCF8A